MTDTLELPLAVIGAGPVGRAAAAHLLACGLTPLIDPNLHNCGTVRPYCVVELTQTERNLFIVGMKSYGRAPTFLVTPGYEQVRSVVAELAGGPVAAREVRMKLPETGVCKVSSAPEASGFCTRAPAATRCGGALKVEATACCAADETVRAQGTPRCGCAQMNAPKILA